MNPPANQTPDLSRLLELLRAEGFTVGAQEAIAATRLLQRLGELRAEGFTVGVQETIAASRFLQRLGEELREEGFTVGALKTITASRFLGRLEELVPALTEPESLRLKLRPLLNVRLLQKPNLLRWQRRPNLPDSLPVCSVG